MAIDYDRLIAWPIPDASQDYAQKDCILYALGLGFGSDPLDPAQLRHAYERDLEPFPTMALVLAVGEAWARDPRTGITYAQVLHAEQRFELHRPLPVRASVLGRSRIAEVIDKGPGRGAIVVAERRLFIDGDAQPVATLRSSLFCRADGGFGGPVTAGAKPEPLPEREPDRVARLATSPRSALLYRLSGDMNELHADPEIAAKAGFRAPILHGLCSFGMAVRSVVAALGVEPRTVTGGGVRFTAPVYPGETLETAIWFDAATARFRTRVVERDVLALDYGRVDFADVEG